MLIQYISRPLVTCSLPTTGVLFSLTHATTHAEHPVQEFRSIAIAHRRHCDSRRSGASARVGSGLYMFSGLIRACASCPWSCASFSALRLGSGTFSLIRTVSAAAIGGILANSGFAL